MLDRWTMPLSGPLLHKVARLLNKGNISPTKVTVIGFLIGISAIPLLLHQLYIYALAAILINRIMDGLDGAVARLSKPSDAGGFLDITLDFIFYAGVVLGFALAEPDKNAIPAALLIFSFMGTGSSFLAFATMAAKHNITSPIYKNKSLYYLGGLTEGTETIIFFVLFCILPDKFPPLAYLFSALCIITTIIRTTHGYKTLKATD